MPKRKSITQPSKRRARASDASAPAPKRRRPSLPPSPSASSASSTPSGDELTAARTFPLLTPRTRSIPEATVRRRWASLAEPAQARVLSLLADLERAAVGGAVPFGARGKAEERRAEAQAAVAQVARQVARRLPRMPFPREAREWEFDGEAVRKATAELEGAATTTRHALVLLRAELEREAEALQDDEAELVELERNARAEAAAMRKARGKRESLLEPRPEDVPEDAAEGINLVDEEPEIDLDQELEDAMRPLARQLGSHLASLESNSDQLRGVEACVVHAAAKIRGLVEVRAGRQAAEQLPAVM